MVVFKKLRTLLNKDKINRVLSLYNRKKSTLKTSIITLTKGAVLYRHTDPYKESSKYVIKGEPDIPLPKFWYGLGLNEFGHNYKFRLKENVKLFAVIIDTSDFTSKQGYIMVHYIVPTLLNSTKPEDLLNNDLILKKLKDLGVDGTLEKCLCKNNYFEVSIPLKYVELI